MSSSANTLQLKNILVNQPTQTPEEAIVHSGQILQQAGYVTPRYIEGMLARDKSFSTAIGNLIAIPHGEKEYKQEILATGLSVLAYPQGIDWNGTPVKLVIGIAAKGDEHLEILERIVESLESEEDVEQLVQKGDAQAIYNLLAGGEANA
ncbi:MAG: PTS sugar transporter subunit IIA [Oscillospiraceae bacterium]